MTSFVREILSASGKLGEKEDLTTKTSRLKKQLEEKKAEMRKEMEGKYIGFLSSFNETSALVSQLEAAVEEVDAHLTTVHHHLKPDLAEGRREMTELLRQLQELSSTVEVANLIKRVYEGMEKANGLLEENKYLEASVKLQEISSIIVTADGPNVESCDEDQVKAFEAAKVEFIVAQEKIHYALGKEWDSKFKIEVKKEKDIIEMVEIVFANDEQQQRETTELLQAMNMADMLNYRVSKFSHLLLVSVLSPVLERKMRVSAVQEGSITLRATEDQKLEMEMVFADLSKMFDFLHEKMSIPLGNDDTLMSLVGQCCSDKFVLSLIKNCLAPSVPSIREELPTFEALLQRAVDLQKNLVDQGFISASNEELIRYARNVDDVFATKRVATILGAARELMKEDLHLTEQVDEAQPYDDEKFHSLAKKWTGQDVKVVMMPELEDLNLPDGFAFNDCIFRFPRCQISRHVLKVVAMVHSTLEEACNSNIQLAGRLVYAARLIFEVYHDVLPIYHKEALQQFPQHSALAFTNCMYLAHQCSILGYEYKSRLPSPLNEQSVTFADMIIKIRTVGLDAFHQQLRRQQNELGAILKESGFSQLQGEAQLPPKTEKTLKQILMQMNRLRNVWQTVLPGHVYSKSIGVLFNYILHELIQRIVKLEDISADSAIQIATLFRYVEEKAPEVFIIDGDSKSSKHDIVRYVRLWQKFKELILVLNASLREIEDRWADGKGPLAVEFPTDEMKQLIRALFQNTDRRAAVLAKIRYES